MKSLRTLMDMTGRVALVTGGAGHIGGAAAESLLELGCTVVLTDLDPGACAEAAGRLEAGVPEGRVSWIEGDLRDEARTRGLVREAVRRHGGLDVLVHSAAFVGTTGLAGWAAPFEEQTVEAWDEALRLNVTSAFVLVQEAAGDLRKSGRGSVVLLSSIYGVVGPAWDLYEGTAMRNPVAYGVSKGGLLQLVRYLATILAPSVRVNALSPGGIWRSQPESFVQRYGKRTPLARMGTEEDMKGAVAYLASDLSGYVTGANLMVDGGWTAQ